MSFRSFSWLLCKFRDEISLRVVGCKNREFWNMFRTLIKGLEVIRSVNRSGEINFSLGLDSFRDVYRAFLIFGNAFHGISGRGPHRCVRIEKPLNLGFCFAQFGLRKPPKQSSNLSLRKFPTWAWGWIAVAHFGLLAYFIRPSGLSRCARFRQVF